jgi:prepilin-type processing-associated H-X9-DG protein
MSRRGGFTVWDTLIVAVLVLVVFLMLAPVFTRVRDGKPNVCLRNVKNIALAVQMYVADNDDHFPPAANWSDVLDEYVKNRDVFQCPQARGGPGWNYAYDPLRASRSMYDLADLANTVAIFESDADRNAAGGPELLPDEPRHLGGDNYGFADGHASWLKRKSAGEDRRGERIWLKEPVKPVRWEP